MTTTDAIALFALALSVISFAWTVGWSAWLYRRPYRTSLYVTVSDYFDHDFNGAGALRTVIPSATYRAILVRITNNGVAPLTVAAVRIRLARRSVGRRREEEFFIPSEWILWPDPVGAIGVGLAEVLPLVRAGSLDSDLRARLAPRFQELLDIVVEVEDTTGRVHQSKKHRLRKDLT